MRVKKYINVLRQYKNSVDARVTALSFWHFILVFSVMTEVVKVIVGAVASILLSDPVERVPWSNTFNVEDYIRLIFLAVCIGPLLETLFFQSFILFIMKKFFKNSPLFPIIISGIIFGINHYYSSVYVVFMMFVGFLWAYGYENRIKSQNNPFFSIFLVHSITNSFSILALFLMQHHSFHWRSM